MDSDAQKDIGWILGQLWPTLVVALVIYGGGITVEQLWRTIVPGTKDLLAGKTTDVDPKLPLWFKLWYATRSAHPFVIGVAVSFIPMMPRPAWVTSQVMAVIWYGGAGGANGQIHLLATGLSTQAQKVVGMLSSFVRKRLGLPTDPPPPADPPATGGAT